MSVPSKGFLVHIPNILSVSRCVAGIVMPFAILSQDPAHHVLAAILFTAAALSDFLDGYIARRFHVESEFGKLIDPVADKVLILFPLWAFSKLGFYSVWWLVPIFAREITVTFARVGWVLDRHIIAAEKWGKWKLASQLGALASSVFYLWCLDFPTFGDIAMTVKAIMQGILILSVLLTVYSGIQIFQHNQGLLRTRSFARYVSAMGVGLIRFAPGTWGSLITVLIIPMVHWNTWLYGVTLFCLMGVGYWAVRHLELPKDADPGFVTVDEGCGMMITLFMIPLSWPTILIGFSLFRLFDILKPFPINLCQKLPGYWGILIDDLLAGLYAWLILFYFIV